MPNERAAVARNDVGNINGVELLALQTSKTSYRWAVYEPQFNLIFSRISLFRFLMLRIDVESVAMAVADVQ